MKLSNIKVGNKVKAKEDITIPIIEPILYESLYSEPTYEIVKIKGITVTLHEIAEGCFQRIEIDLTKLAELMKNGEIEIY